MKRNHLWVGLLCSVAALGAATPAFAGIEECGDISIDAEATCTVQVEGGCEAQCTPLSVEAACAGELEVDCRGQCDVDAEVTCSATCNIATCVAECDIDLAGSWAERIPCTWRRRSATRTAPLPSSAAS